MKNITVTFSIEEKDVNKMNKFLKETRYLIFLRADGKAKTITFEDGFEDIVDESDDEEIDEDLDLIQDIPELIPNLTFPEYID